MELAAYQYIIAIAGGFFAGCINTLAGSGSAITLSILTEIMGLPGNMANGSNRVGVVGQGIFSSYSFHKNGKLQIQANGILLLTITIGAIAGVWVATIVSNQQFMMVFKYLMVLMLLVIVVKPKRWLIETDRQHQVPIWLSVPLFLALGFYGGFIQMGMGIFFLVITVLLLKKNLIEANAIKSFCVLLYSVLVLTIFHYKGLVNWKVGGILAIGQIAGGYVTAEFASKYKGADVWAYRLLVVIVVLVILRLFGLFEWVFKLLSY